MWYVLIHHLRMHRGCKNTTNNVLESSDHDCRPQGTAAGLHAYKNQLQITYRYHTTTEILSLCVRVR